MATKGIVNLESRIVGTIYGNCIGDAIGLLTEFMTKDEAKKYYKTHVSAGGLEFEHKVPDMHRARWKAGDWTDDSDQMILIMESLHDKGQVDAVDYGQKLLRWAREGFKELGDLGGMGIGATTYHVLHHELYKEDPHAAAADIWEKTDRHVAPNGAVMRTSILGVYQYKDTSKVIENCKQLCKVTHADPRCQASCIAVCCAISYMLQGKYLDKSGKLDMKNLIKDCYEEARKVFAKDKVGSKHQDELKKHMYATKLKDLHLDEHKAIGYTFKCLGAGFWALRQDDFRKALTELTMEGGDSDTNGAVAGAMLGCKLGFHKLPESWCNKLYYRQWLDNKIHRFLKAFLKEIDPITLVAYKEIDGITSEGQEESQKAEDKEQEQPSTNQTEEPQQMEASKGDQSINFPDVPYADEALDEEDDNSSRKT